MTTNGNCPKDSFRRMTIKISTKFDNPAEGCFILKLDLKIT